MTLTPSVEPQISVEEHKSPRLYEGRLQVVGFGYGARGFNGGSAKAARVEANAWMKDGSLKL